jgi:hypothetical protein
VIRRRLPWGAYDAHGVTLDMDYVIVPVPVPPALPATPVPPAAGPVETDPDPL